MTQQYQETQARLARGWNTWWNDSVLAHVHLPEAFCVSLGLKDRVAGVLPTGLIGRRDPAKEIIVPGPRTYDGGYTEVTATWAGSVVEVRTACDGDDFLALVVPRRLPGAPRTPPTLLANVGFLWGRPGRCWREGDALQAASPAAAFVVRATAPTLAEPGTPFLSPYLATRLDGPVAIYTGRERTLAEIQGFIERRRAAVLAERAGRGAEAEIHAAMQTCLAWDTIFDPVKGRVVSPVSRHWNYGWGGYVLFCWDNYFAGAMAAADSRDLAYANVVEITREITPEGFVPNYAGANGSTAWDRSQPPVGALTIWALYEKFGDRWLLEETFPALLRWNRWWPEHRDTDGLLCWGSDPTPERYRLGFEREVVGVHDNQGARYESGLDNSPLYDDVPFDAQRCQLRLADAGLNGLYVADCQALAKIAAALGDAAAAAELRERGERYARATRERLWSEERGIFLNRRTDTGEFSPRLAPTNFYPLLAGIPTLAQARRMMDEHFFNPREFAGEWILPSISRDDPAFPDNNYWRGRVWGPMNWLVYLGLKNYDLPEARRELAEKSEKLLLKEWRERGHVHENYSSVTGAGCDESPSDTFYHWGGLLGLVALDWKASCR